MKMLNIKTAGVFLLIILIVTTLFSRTIYSFNMPTVTAASPHMGRLNKKETTKGVVDWAKIDYVYSAISGKIEEVLVSEGDVVYKGQPLVKLSFDIHDLNDSLSKLEMDKKKLLVDIENINIKTERLNYNIAELLKEEYEKDEVSYHELNKMENDVLRQETKIKSTQEHYSGQITLYEAGVISKKELEDAENELNNLMLEYENLIISMQNLIETIEKDKTKAEENVNDKEEARESQLKDYRHEIELLNQDLKMKYMDIERNDQEQSIINRTLLEYTDNIFINSNVDGTVQSIDINRGAYINQGTLMCSIGVGNEYVIEAQISIDNNFVGVLDEPYLTSLLHSSNSITGTVSKITPNENSKKVTISIKSDEITIGETFDITFEKESNSQYTLVPNGAINMDSDGHFLYVIKRRDGILGKEYYTEKVSVYIGDSDNENTVVTNRINFLEPVVQFSDKTFSEGESVKIENEGDFFVD